MSCPIRSMALASGFALVLASTSGSLSTGAASPDPEPSPDTQTGLPVGAKAPKFTLKDQEGKDRSLDEILKQGKAAVVFYRSADW